MSPEQAITVKRLAFWGGGGLAWLFWLLGIEIMAVRQGGDSTISRVIWGLWSDQPWVIWLVSVLVAFILGFFGGHFVAQSDVIYNRIR
jgi:hypothetical protein